MRIIELYNTHKILPLAARLDAAEGALRYLTAPWWKRRWYDAKIVGGKVSKWLERRGIRLYHLDTGLDTPPEEGSTPLPRPHLRRHVPPQAHKVGQGMRGPGPGPGASNCEYRAATGATAADRLGHRLKTLTHPALLVVDEIGYMPVNQTGRDALLPALINPPLRACLDPCSRSNPMSHRHGWPPSGKRHPRTSMSLSAT